MCSVMGFPQAFPQRDLSWGWRGVGVTPLGGPCTALDHQTVLENSKGSRPGPQAKQTVRLPCGVAPGDPVHTPFTRTQVTGMCPQLLHFCKTGM